MVSKKGMEPSSLLSSTVNLMAGSTLLMCWRKPCLLASLQITKVSSTNLHQNLGGGVQCLGHFALRTPCKGLLLWDLLGNPWLHPQPVQRTGLGRRNRCFSDKNPIGEWCHLYIWLSYPWGWGPLPIDPLLFLRLDLWGLMWRGLTHSKSWGIPLALEWCVWPVPKSPGCWLCGGGTCLQGVLRY